MLGLINTALLRMSMAVDGLLARRDDEGGQTLIEYGLLGGFIAVSFAVLAVGVFPTALSGLVNGVAECIDFDTICPGP